MWLHASKKWHWTFVFVGIFIVSSMATTSSDNDELKAILGSESVEAATSESPPASTNTNKTKKLNIVVSTINEEGEKVDSQPGPSPSVLESSTEDSSSSAASPDSKANNVTPKNNQTESPESVFLPAEGAAEKEHSSSLAIFFVLFVLILVIFLVHFLLQNKCHYVPESLAVVFLGGTIGLAIKLLPSDDLKKAEYFSPTTFFLVLLPPIIFESGYNLHKGNFFTNLGSILLFAIVGTTISALVVGGGVYLLGLADLVYPLSFVESFAFGSLISAVDPVATLAIFQALDVEPVLNMLVFGESILNDAVAIVLASTVVESENSEGLSNSERFWTGIGRFLVTFLGSAGIGTVIGLFSSLLLKHVDLYYNPSLEFALMLCFVYLPYALAEGIHLSGIMAILFCGIVMSQYTHYNLSPVTQITMQQTMRTLAFVCESCVFAYLGLALFSFPLRFEMALIIWSLIFVLLGRALNIFPLAALSNRWRSHQITKKMMVIMWFSGLRGAIAYALSLHLEFGEDTRKVLVTTTLVIILFTTLVFGGGTMPLMKYLEKKKRRTQPMHNREGRRKKRKEITLSKTKELGTAIDSEYLSELTEEELDSTATFSVGSKKLNGFLYWDYKYFRPFFIRKFTQRELKEGKKNITDLTDKWFNGLQASPLLVSESDDDELEVAVALNPHHSNKNFST